MGLELPILNTRWGAQLVEGWEIEGQKMDPLSGVSPTTASTLNDVINIGEISDHLTVVENIYRLTLQNRFRKEKQRHIRTAPGAIHSEKTEPCSRQPVQVAIGMSHQLIGFLASGIKAHRVVHTVSLTKRHTRVAAIYRTTAGVHKMLNAMMPAPFQNMAEPDKICLDISRWVFDRVTHTSLGRQVHNLPRPEFTKRRLNRRPILEISFNQMKRASRTICRGLKLSYTSSLQRRIIVRIYIVKSNNFSALLEQSFT